jgi:GDSL-like Lipase/Acylhydrolase family
VVFQRTVFIVGFFVALTSLVTIVFVLFARDWYIRTKMVAASRHNVSRYADLNSRLGPKTLERIVLFGDSRISDWNPLPNVPSSEFINRGVGGETTKQMRFRFSSDVLALDPDVVVIEAGINDLVAASLDPGNSHEIVQRLKSNLPWFIQKAHSAGISVILMTIVRPAEPPLIRRIVWSDSIFDLVREVNGYLMDLQLPPAVCVLDADGLLNPDGGPLGRVYANGTLHWSTSAYEELNSRLKSCLDAAAHSKLGPLEGAGSLIKCGQLCVGASRASGMPAACPLGLAGA